MYAAGAAYYAALVEGLKSFGETDLGYGKVGGLVVAEDRQEFEAAAERVARRVANVPEAGTVEHLSAAAAREKFPPLREDMEAIFIPGAARVDARLLAAAMLRAAASLGAKVRQDRVSLVLKDRKPVCTAGDGTVVEADEIVVTAGAGLRRYLIRWVSIIRLSRRKGRSFISVCRVSRLRTGQCSCRWAAIICWHSTIPAW